MNNSWLHELQVKRDLINSGESVTVTINPVGLIEVTKIFPHAYNRLVFRGIKPGDDSPLIYKAFLLADKPRSMLTREVLGTYEELMANFRADLNGVGVKIPTKAGFISIMEDMLPTGDEPYLLQWETDMGPTCTDLLEKADERMAKAILYGILNSAVIPLFTNATHRFQSYMVEVGMDLAVRNFCAKELSGSTITDPIYVDLFPPKLFLPHISIVFPGKVPSEKRFTLEFPEPQNDKVRELGIFRHFDKAGLIINLWCSFVRNRPDYAELIYFELEKFLRSTGFNDVEERINRYLAIEGVSVGNFPLKVGRFSQDEITRIISNFGLFDVFLVRLLALALAYYRGESRGSLEKVFQLTHFSSGPPDEQNFAIARETVIEMAKCPVDYS